MTESIVPTNQIAVTAHQQDTHVIYVCDQTKQPYANLAQIEKIFPDTAKHKLHYRLKGVENRLVKKAQVQTPGGLQGVQLYPASVISDLAFEFDLPLAKQMATAGAAVYLYGLAGYQVTAEKSIAFEIPDTLEDALILAANEIKARKLAEAQSKQLEAEKNRLQGTIELQAPAVNFALAVQASSNSIDLNAFAKSIGTGRNRLFAAMREAGVIMKNSTLPYQELISAGYFEVSQEIDESGRTIPFALITGKGQLWLKQRLDDRKRLQTGIANAITRAVQIDLELG